MRGLRARLWRLVALCALLLARACDGASGDLLTTIPEPETPSAEHCVTRLGSDSVDSELCATPTTWLAIARADCDGLSLTLQEDSLATGEACDPDAAGRARYLQARYDCCLPSGCRLEQQGDGVSCLDEAAWRTRATTSCALGGLPAVTFVGWSACADAVTWSVVEYACCP